MAGGFNGSGTYTLPQAAFVPSTPISSSAMNSNLSSIATDGLSLVICKDGQTTITGALKGATGSVGAPSYSFSADLDCGMYRIGANNIGISVNATKILDIATTGLTVTGTLASTGTFSPTGVILAGDGTVLLPAYSFTTDPDSGVYRIGANNIGVAVNAAKVLDISTSGLNVIGSVSSNGAAFSPTAQAAGMVNGTIVESHAGNAVTFAIKTLAGADPSATDIVYCVFRNVTAATGNYVVLQLTSALSLTVSSGSTLGTVNNLPFRLWLVLFNDASTIRLGVINCVSGANIYQFAQFPIASSTAEGGAGGADSAQVFYTGSAVTSKAYAAIGYASYEAGLGTVGSWGSAPTRLQLLGDNVPLPGAVIQTVTDTTTTVGSTTSASFVSLTNTQSKAFTRSSAANLVKITVIGTSGTSTAQSSFLQLQQGSTLIGNPMGIGSTGIFILPMVFGLIDAPGATNPSTYSFQGKTNAGTISYPAASTGSYMILEEIMA